MKRKYIKRGPPEGKFAPRLTREGMKIHDLKEADNAQDDAQKGYERRDRAAHVRSNMWRIPFTRFFAGYEGNATDDNGIMLTIGHRQFYLLRNMNKASHSTSRSARFEPVWVRIREFNAK